MFDSKVFNYTEEEYIKLSASEKREFVQLLRNNVFKQNKLFGHVTSRLGNRIWAEIYRDPNLLEPLQNPLTDINETWEISGLLSQTNDDIALGDYIEFEYEYLADDEERHMKQIIRMTRSSIKRIVGLQAFLADYGLENYKEALEQYFEIQSDDLGEDRLFPLVLTHFMKMKNPVTSEIRKLRSEKQLWFNEITRLDEHKAALTAEINEKIQKLTELKDALAEQEEKLEFLGFRKQKTYSKTYQKLSEIASSKDLIDFIQGYLHQQSELQYSKDIIERFYLGLKTNQLIVLTGPSGTGKTSLVNGFAKAIENAEARIVSVQPNWTDNHDLLGFFNPVDRTYISTPFLDTLVEAQQNPEALYLVCLDEMNLSHVEYYFSEFLSTRELEEPTLQLYSPYLEQQVVDYLALELSNVKQTMIEPTYESIQEFLKENEIDNYSELKRMWDSLQRYRSSFTIPSNIRFIGTMNMDETVKQLSPKVIDRSFVIEVERVPTTDISIREDISYEVPVYLDIQQFISPPRNVRVDLKTLTEKLVGLNELGLNTLNATINKRSEKHIKEYLGYGNWIPEEEIIAQLISSKILPRIRFMKSEGQKEQAFSALKTELMKLSSNVKVKEKLDTMSASGKRIVSFWG
ncbi:McrB family protein [Ectobacillus antri]|uniref:McrB family protein n=1 Tax=Ectobacillus antri TaxID=2486280 RepID=UPI000F59007A|nr:AAA family ATPase [Ectobacillus antri]